MPASSSTDRDLTTAPAAPAPRVLTMDDVHRLIGALMLELDQVRRETAALRAQLAARDGAGPGESHGH